MSLSDEWRLLQSQHAHYEFAALAIKLSAVAVFAVVVEAQIAAPALLLLWLQEAMLKTYQARLGTRLLRVERLLAGSTPPDHGAAMQLHTEWLAARPRGLALLREYAVSACRPTVLLPYPVLLALRWLV